MAGSSEKIHKADSEKWGRPFPLHHRTWGDLIAAKDEYRPELPQFLGMPGDTAIYPQETCLKRFSELVKLANRECFVQSNGRTRTGSIFMSKATKFELADRFVFGLAIGFYGQVHESTTFLGHHIVETPAKFGLIAIVSDDSPFVFIVDDIFDGQRSPPEKFVVAKQPSPEEVVKMQKALDEAKIGSMLMLPSQPLKIGDRVKINWPNHASHGWTGVVVEDGAGCLVMPDLGLDPNCQNWRIPASRLELESASLPEKVECHSIGKGPHPDQFAVGSPNLKGVRVKTHSPSGLRSEVFVRVDEKTCNQFQVGDGDRATDDCDTPITIGQPQHGEFSPPKKIECFFNPPVDVVPAYQVDKEGRIVVNDQKKAAMALAKHLKDIELREEIQSSQPLNHSPDAAAWAEEFIRHVRANPSIATDFGTMLGWFANAMMAMHDHVVAKYEKEKAEQRPSPKTFSEILNIASREYIWDPGSDSAKSE